MFSAWLIPLWPVMSVTGSPCGPLCPPRALPAATASPSTRAHTASARCHTSRMGKRPDSKRNSAGRSPRHCP